MYNILAITRPKKKDQTKMGCTSNMYDINLANDKILINIPRNNAIRNLRLYTSQ